MRTWPASFSTAMFTDGIMLFAASAQWWFEGHRS
jgi:hypothetical protein